MGLSEKKPEKQGAHETPSLLQLDDGIQSLCLLGSFKGASGMQLFLESHYPYQRISLDDSTLSELSPDLMLVGARDAEELVERIRELGQSLTGNPVMLAMVDDYNESDVLALMDEGVSTVITDYSDLLAFKASLAAAVNQAVVLRDKHAQLKDVTATAHTALKTASEIGMLMQYLQQSTTKTDMETLVDVTESFIRNLGLKGCFRARMLDQDLMRSTEGEPSAIQLTLLESLSERITQKGRILGLCGKSTAWVVSGPALVDEAFSGRMRDILIQGVDILDAKIHGLEMIEMIRQQHSQVFGVITLLQNSLIDSQHATKHIMKHLAMDIEQAAISLDLTEEQERSLLALSNSALDQMESLFAGFSLLERHFMAVLKGLEKVKEMADASVAKPEGDGEPGASGDAVELF
ncbi:MAG: hypothetical protein IPM37_10890 [Hahellaceae bacterium]|nr:hypothetical protein [Hahellaceae bacterium]